jgi:TonB-linked SusC/RagA family outer membrane protein
MTKKLQRLTAFLFSPFSNEVVYANAGYLGSGNRLSGAELLKSTVNKFRILILPVFLACIVAGSAAAQDRTVSGIVTDSETQEPLPGVTVLLEGTTNGVATNLDGEYELEVSSSEFSNGVLLVSSVGFVTQRIQINSRTDIDVVLVPDIAYLDDVVVVGYGSQIKEKVTGNISSVKASDFETVPVNSFEQAVQGRAAGVFINADNGKLGGGITVRVRGTSSITASAQPLYVIDGIPVTTINLSNNGSETNPLADINPDDIESIDILKDASASAIYGARGANGVVLITTKSGAAGATKIDVSYKVSTREPTNTKEWLNGEEYIELFDEAFVNSSSDGTINGTIFGYTRDGLYDLVIPGWDTSLDTDWQEEAFQENTSQTFEISASGGDEKTTFYVSSQIDDQEGHMIQDEFQRMAGRLNLDHQASDKFKVGMNLSLYRTENERLSNDNSFSTPLQLVALPPIQPMLDPDGTPYDNTLYFNGLLYKEGSSYTTTVLRTLGKAYVGYEFTPQLSLRGELGIDILDQQEKVWFGSTVARNTGAANGLARNAFDRVTNLVSNAYLEYITNLSTDHSLNAVVGTSYQNSLREWNSVSGQDFANDDLRQVNSAATITAGQGGVTEYAFVGYFARANYSFRDKYLLSVSGRVDGSSRFGANNQYGFFPAASVGWILSSEDFLADMDRLSFLKVRASWGETGNAEINNFASQSLYGAGAYNGLSGLQPTLSPNPDLKWETTTQYNVGLDFGFFSDRITGEVDYYIKDTEDLLLNVNVPSTSGAPGQTQTRNVGSLENKGVEFVITTRNLVGEFNWSTTFNFGRNRNEIKDIDGQNIGGINRAIEGEPIGVFYAYEYAGVNSETGDGEYWVNSPDGIDHSFGKTNNPNEANQVVIGDPNPDFQGGLTNNFNYKGFDLNIFFQFVYGNEIYNQGGIYQSCNACYFDNQTKDQLDRWQQPGDITDVPQARLFQSNGDAESTRYLSDGSYLRLKNLTFGYNLPVNMLDRLALRRARIYFSGTNLLTFTDYDGWDPEVTADFYTGNINFGRDFYSAPQAKIYTVGIDIGF